MAEEIIELGNSYLSDVQIDLEKIMDKTTGAPAGVRQSVGSAHTPEDRLATLRNFYPDAQPFGEDNFMFFNGNTGRLTLYNPEGLDIGDVASVGRETAEMVGGGIGAGAGAVMAAPSAVVSGPVGPGLGAVVGAGVGTGMAGSLYDFLAGPLLGTVDTRGTGEKVLQGGVDVFGGAVGEGLGQAATTALRRTAAGLQNTAFGDNIQNALRGYDRAGVTPNSAGAVTGNNTLQAMEQGLANVPGGMGVIEEARLTRLAEIEAAVERIGGNVPTASSVGLRPGRVGAGEALQQGGRDFVSGFTVRADELYGALDSALPDNPILQMTNTAEALSSRAKVFSDPANPAPALGAALTDPTMAKFAKAIEEAGGTLTWAQAKELRSFIGQELATPSIMTNGAKRAELNSIYAALSRDLEAAAEAAGPDAVTAFRQANDFYSAGMSRIEGALSDILKDGASGESVFGRVKRLATSGRASEDISSLFQIRSSMPEESWDVYALGLLEEMGSANPGASADDFSPSTFLTNWRRMSDASKNAVFSGTRYGGLKSELDNLAKVLGSERNLDLLRNTSGTTRTLISALLFTGSTMSLTGDPRDAGYALVGSLIAPRAAAKLLTNPRFVRWLADVPLGSGNLTMARGRGAIDEAASWIGRLYTVAEAEPTIADEIHQLIQASQPVNPAPAAAQSAPPSAVQPLLQQPAPNMNRGLLSAPPTQASPMSGLLSPN
jgi:hypothetical protein